jgi:hypothetical protein
LTEKRLFAIFVGFFAESGWRENAGASSGSSPSCKDLNG